MMLMKYKNEVNMKKEEFMLLMHFPNEWSELLMYPDELFYEQLKEYEIEKDDEGSEHYRNGAFHWWLRANPEKSILIKLTHLTFLDLEQLMADDVRSYIIKANYFDTDIEEIMKNLYIEKLYEKSLNRGGGCSLNNKS